MNDHKATLDAIAAALYGWPNDGVRRAYAPDELPVQARRLRLKANRWLAYRESALAPLADAWDAGRKEWSNENPYRIAMQKPDCVGCGLRYSQEPSVALRADGKPRCNDCWASAAQNKPE